MSRTLSSSSMSRDASLEGKSRQRGSNSVRAMLRLVSIDFRRCGGYWILPLALPLIWYINSDNELDDGIVVWPRISERVLQAYVILGPLTAGVVAWLIMRDRRRRTTELVETTSTDPFRRDLALLSAGLGWGLAGYAFVAVWYGGMGVAKATWGGPDVPFILAGVLTIPAYSALGLVIGRAIPGRIGVFATVAVAFMIPIVSDLFRIGVTDQPLRLLSPFGLTRINEPSVWYRNQETYVGESILWTLGMTGVLLAVVAILRGRSRIRVGALVASLAVAVLGAVPLVTANQAWGDNTMERTSFEWVCEKGAVAEVCVHPAHTARLGETAGTINELLMPIADLAGVPERFEEDAPWGQGDDSPGFYGFQKWTLLHSIGTAVLPGDPQAELLPWNATQLVILKWLGERAGIEGTLIPEHTIPSEVPVDMSQGFMPDEAALAELQPKMNAAVDRFAALSPEQQRAWLEANWDALRAGELTLEDMP